MAQMVGPGVDTGGFGIPEAGNAVAQVIFTAVPWKAALRNPYVFAVKIGALGAKLMLPEWQPYRAQDERGAQAVAVANAVHQFLVGVDPEDLLVGVARRIAGRTVADYIFMSPDGGTQFTLTLYWGDP